MATRLIVSGGHVLSMDERTGDLPVGDVLIVDGRIAGVGERLDADGAEVIDAAGAIVLPGLVDGHRHLWQTLLRGVGVDWTLPDYMIEARSMYCGCFDPDAAYLSNYIGGLESISAGITTVIDHSHLQSSPQMSDALVKGLLDSGVGGVFCYAMQNVPDFVANPAINTSEVRDLITRFPDDWHDDNVRRIRDEYFPDPAQRLRLGIALPESAAYLPLAVIRPLLERMRSLDPFLLTSHWDAGTTAPVSRELAAGGDWPERTSLTHCNHLGDEDLDALARAGVGICTTPDIECGMGTGPLAARRYLERGGAASLGTDLSSYARADILQQARLLLQVERMSAARESGHLPTTIGWHARAALELATRTAAESLGLGFEVGSLTIGKRGDLVLVRPDPLTGGGDPTASLLFYTSPAEVDTVIVAGDVLKRNGLMVGVDLGELRDAASVARARVGARYENLPRPMLQGVWNGMFG